MTARAGVMTSKRHKLTDLVTTHSPRVTMVTVVTIVPPPLAGASTTYLLTCLEDGHQASWLFQASRMVTISRCWACRTPSSWSMASRNLAPKQDVLRRTNPQGRHPREMGENRHHRHHRHPQSEVMGNQQLVTDNFG
jgi:hypothetical protein